MTRIRVAVLALIAVAALPISAARGEEAVVDRGLGADGQLISLLRGTYGELFPDGSAADAEEPVLALEMALADGTRRREVVPATLEYDREDSPKLVVEARSGAAFVFWQSWRTHIHSNFRVASFDGEQWGEPIDVAGPSWSRKLAPAFAVTHDSFVDLLDEEDPPGTLVERTVIHLMWIEEAADATWRTSYTPLVLVDGGYIGDHPILALEDLVPADGEAVGTDLRIAPVLRPRDGENGVVAAFVDQRTGRLAAMELRFAAGELSLLGDAVEAEIESFAAANAASGGEAVDHLVNAVEDRLLEYDDHIRSEVLGPLTADIAGHLRGQLPDGSGIASVKGGARAHVIEVGFRLTDGRVARVKGGARAHVIEVGARKDGPRKHRRHDARASLTSSRPVPTTSTVPEILVSSSGAKLMLVWHDAGRLRYRESSADGGWKATQQVLLTGQMDAAKAMAVLQRRVDQQ